MKIRYSLLPLAIIPVSLAMASTAAAAPPGEGGAAAAETAGSVGADADAEGPGSAAATGAKKGKDRGDQKWIKRWAPERNMGELGVYGGVFLPNKKLELFDPDSDLPKQGFRKFNAVAPDLGVRLGYYPSRFFGIEGEGGVIPLRTDAGAATGFTFRGQLVGQLGLWSVTPFVLAGFGGLGVGSDRSVVGNDIDPAFHFGGGVKIFVNRFVALRLDVRDVMSHLQGVDATFKSHSFEALLGLSVTLGRKKKEKAPAPAPASPKDTDGDGFLDPDDACVDVPGIAPDGCPEKDSDGDGFLDSVDACVDEPGIEPDGCPIRDTDGDGIMDPDDGCIDEPETKNGFEDADGCPDEVPDAIKKFTGAIEGIFFDTNKDTIKPSSEKILKQALKVLEDFPELKLKITGHTDNRGKPDHNLDLSRRRAKSVKAWLVSHGIGEDRMTTDGFGPEKPVDTNDTKAGRAKNRRIEFQLQQ